MRKIYVPNIYVKITVLISNGSLASIINASMLKTVLSKSEEIMVERLLRNHNNRLFVKCEILIKNQTSKY